MILIGNKADLVQALREEATKFRLKATNFKDDGRRTDENIQRRCSHSSALAAAVAYEYAAELAEAMRSFDGPSSDELLARLRKQQQDAIVTAFGKKEDS